eukprot:12976563-Alexandrium_andersonii.AAC.1
MGRSFQTLERPKQHAVFKAYIPDFEVIVRTVVKEVLDDTDTEHSIGRNLEPSRRAEYFAVLHAPLFWSMLF